ncbi:hypothetical protein HS088_TW10G00063 [Tripterygium wilfordii]|uniref:Uncharacterized protein n=1 Tax=Tripterygium wilfordii TaxID=458696 RepID=A0A7J7D468_TRIWF|nr:uncharacterized protein LOC120007973 [Tripterygium wilfordii]KAF5741068.1 hypothetical protein HS088_TW10G00063 [Tripterygium wilfordii]
MQANPISVNRCSSNDLAEINGKFSEDVEEKLRLQIEEEDEEEPKQELEEEEEEEFSFVVRNPDGSPVSADQAFQNGLIRPMYPLFNQDLLYESGTQTLRPPLKKLFVEECDSDKLSDADEEVSGPSCAWSGKAVDASPEHWKKSNSTGFSKLRRLRELVLRSNSDGKDAFVFFHSNNPSSTTTTKTTRTKNIEKSEKKENYVEKKAVKVKGEGKGKTAPSAHEQLYVKNKAMREGEKHRSYLPYRVGFFTSVNGMSRNVHPF